MNLQIESEDTIRLFPKRHVLRGRICKKTTKNIIKMAYKVSIFYLLYMPPYYLGNFTEYLYLITFSSLPTLMNAAIARSKCSRS